MNAREIMAIENERGSFGQSIMQSLRVYVQYAHIGYEILASVLISLGLGYGFDSLLDWYPALTISFAVIGVMLGVLITVRSFNKLPFKQKDNHENENSHD